MAIDPEWLIRRSSKSNSAVTNASAQLRVWQTADSQSAVRSPDDQAANLFKGINPDSKRLQFPKCLVLGRFRWSRNRAAASSSRVWMDLARSSSL